MVSEERLPTDPLSEPQPPAIAPPLPPSIGDEPAGAGTWLFATGVRRGEIAPVRTPDGRVAFSHPGFASVAGPIATAISVIVLLAGFATALFLFGEGLSLRAAATFLLTLGFVVLIAMAIPRPNVTLFDADDRPLITISQLSVFPSSQWLLTTSDGTLLAAIRKTQWSRLGRNRWHISNNGRYLGEAFEESWVRAWMRKLLGRFSRQFESDVMIASGAVPAARIHRRPDAGTPDRLELLSDVLDVRIVLGLTVLLLGREP